MDALKNKEQMITPHDIIHKFNDLIFSDTLPEYITVLSKTIDKQLPLTAVISSMEEFRKLTEDEQWELIRKTTPEKRDYESRIIFKIDDISYEVIDNHTHGYILVSTDKSETFSFDSQYEQTPSSDVDTFRKVINKISVEYPHSAFPNSMTNYSKTTFNTVIGREGSRTITPFFDDSLINLFVMLKSLFTADEQLAIDLMNSTQFNPYCGRSYKELKEYFTVWMKKLVAKKHTATNPLVFNDLDNEAYYISNTDKAMIIQSSQNTIFAYGMDLKTSVIKIWTCAKVDNSPHEIESSVKYLVQSPSYIEVMKTINQPYSYYSYPFEIMGDTYPKSAHYFFDNFEDEGKYLVFTSKDGKGFRLNSEYSECVATDIPLLLQVVYSI